MTHLTIAAELDTERQRQIESEGFSPQHDDGHPDGALALAAALYATPILLYKFEKFATSYGFADAFPWWDGDRRPYNGNVLLPNSGLSYPERRRQLIKAGALVIAEIERMDRAEQAAKDIEGLANE